MTRKANKDREIARKLRVEEKKSFREIANITGISKTQLCKWAKDEGWPNPDAERRNLRVIAKLNVGRTSHLPEQLISDMPKVDMTKPIKKLAEDMFRWSGSILQNASSYSLQAAIKLFEASTKLIVALGAGQGEQRLLTVYVPEETEVYEGAPSESTKENNVPNSNPDKGGLYEQNN